MLYYINLNNFGFYKCIFTTVQSLNIKLFKVIKKLLQFGQIENNFLIKYYLLYSY